MADTARRPTSLKRAAPMGAQSGWTSIFTMPPFGFFPLLFDSTTSSSTTNEGLPDVSSPRHEKHFKHSFLESKEEVVEEEVVVEVEEEEADEKEEGRHRGGGRVPSHEQFCQAQPRMGPRRRRDRRCTGRPEAPARRGS
jgi:hypothetical protein